MHAAEQSKQMRSELAALRDKYAVMEEARDAEMLRMTNWGSEIADLRTKLEEVQAELAWEKLGFTNLHNRALEAERRLTQARAEALEEAMAVVRGCMSDHKIGGYYTIGWNDAIVFALTNIRAKKEQA